MKGGKNMAKNNNAVWMVVLIAVIAFFLFIIPLGGRLGGLCGMMGNYYGTNYSYGMMGGFGWIFMLVVLVALILLIVWLVQQLQHPKHSR